MGLLASREFQLIPNFISPLDQSGGRRPDGTRQYDAVQSRWIFTLGTTQPGGCTRPLTTLSLRVARLVEGERPRSPPTPHDRTSISTQTRRDRTRRYVRSKTGRFCGLRCRVFYFVPCCNIYTERIISRTFVCFCLHFGGFRFTLHNRACIRAKLEYGGVFF